MGVVGRSARSITIPAANGNRHAETIGAEGFRKCINQIPVKVQPRNVPRCVLPIPPEDKM